MTVINVKKEWSLIFWEWHECNLDLHQTGTFNFTTVDIIYNLLEKVKNLKILKL